MVCRGEDLSHVPAFLVTFSFGKWLGVNSNLLHVYVMRVNVFLIFLNGSHFAILPLFSYCVI